MFSLMVTKKRMSFTFIIFILLAVFVCTIMFRAEKVYSAAFSAGEAKTEEQRVMFLQEKGYSVDKNYKSEKKETVIPYVFSDVYKNYNEIQKIGGYNLENFCGKKVEIYTYKLIYSGRDDVYAHIILYNSAVIGGDIAAISADSGFMNPLK